MESVEYKKQTIRVRKTTVFCDKCNEEVKKDKYDAFDCTMELITGSNDAYDGSFCGDNFRVDLCEPCATFVFNNLFPNNRINVINENDE